MGSSHHRGNTETDQVHREKGEQAAGRPWNLAWCAAGCQRRFSPLPLAPEALFRESYPEIGAFDYSWSIVNDPQKAERVESAQEEIMSSRSNLGLDTIEAHIESEKMQSSLIWGGLWAVE